MSVFNQRTTSPAPRETFYFAFKVLDIFRIHLWKIICFTKVPFSFRFSIFIFVKTTCQNKNSLSCKALFSTFRTRIKICKFSWVSLRGSYSSVLSFEKVCESSSSKRCCWVLWSLVRSELQTMSVLRVVSFSMISVFFPLLIFCSCFKRWGFKSLDRFSVPSLNQLFFFIIWERSLTDHPLCPSSAFSYTWCMTRLYDSACYCEHYEKIKVLPPFLQMF